MKKLIYGACAAMLVAASACAKGDDAASQLPTPLTDSISSYFGSTYGGYILNDFKQYSKKQDKQSKQDVLKGIQYAVSNAGDENVIIGMQIGGQLVNQIKGMEEAGIKVDKTKMMKELTRMFMQDSIDMEQIQQLNGMLTTLMQRAEVIKSQDKVKADEAFIAKLKKETPGLQTSKSGLRYVIQNKGEGATPTDTSMVVVNYVGKLADGTVFDQSQEGQPATFGVGQVIAGFKEGLKLLGKGGKATLYIPGNLAYGEQGVPQAGIGPNAMLIFDVEVVDIK